MGGPPAPRPAAPSLPPRVAFDKSIAQCQRDWFSRNESQELGLFFLVLIIRSHTIPFMYPTGIIQFLPSVDSASHAIKEHQQDADQPNPQRK